MAPGPRPARISPGAGGDRCKNRLYSQILFCYEGAMNDRIRYLLCGLAMGAADVVPGVSGGTVAFITGIYPRIFQAVEAINVEFFKRLLGFRLREAFAQIPWGFLVPLLCGIAASIFSLAKSVTYALSVWPITIWSFFFGLIVASVFLLGKDLRLERASTWVALAAGAAAGWLISGASAVDIGQSLPMFFASGFIAICAMILPGISGAFILVLLGQYSHVIQAVADLNFKVLVVFALGCVLGITTFARVLNRLLTEFPNTVTSVLTGLMAGALRAVWPWREGGMPVMPPGLDAEVAAGAALCLFGMAVPIALTFFSQKKAKN